MGLGVAAAKTRVFQARALAIDAPAWPNFGREVTRVNPPAIVYVCVFDFSSFLCVSWGILLDLISCNIVSSLCVCVFIEAIPRFVRLLQSN